MISGRLPGLNEMIAVAKQRYGGKSLGYARMKRAEEVRVAEAIRAAKCTPVQYPVFLYFCWTEPNRRRDPDNITAGRKFIFDALVTCGVLPDDGWKEVRGWQDTWKMEKGGNGKVEVWIDEKKIETKC